ncbi:uncharacterized protein LAESUDRAFT_725251 [Laetiporus sulphureus 93-53]|uniref:Uncharacterized protein n=1 Tax=Laetiporus sulphureus 93-53 TaxID=1314785 RepID=A0A165EM10_9APHY|nr:uncharacterized protein LAESUDRAFT_725251 [Laetiporus sulphureus 93-53]KZT07339.1 hypothetical protein LAESUDRAFT_725251 [Laetiporus sulphureus 93-53]
MSVALAEFPATETTQSAPKYSFLLHPPPQKKRPTKPLPATPAEASSSSNKPISGSSRSPTTSAITAWIANVQPGSPAPPTPKQKSQISNTHRPSVTSLERSSASCITPSAKDFKHDLTTVGYASVFVAVPYTPFSAAYPSTPASQAPKKPARRGLKHFRSLSALKSTRSSSNSTNMPAPVPLVKKSIPKVPATTRAQSKDTVSKSKKSQYAKYCPPTFATELALAQLADGGKMDDHIRRFAEAQARAGGAQMVNGVLVGVGDAWRDGQGGVWRDQDEEWEYAHLLGADDECDGDVDGGWVRFGSASGASRIGRDERRWSVSSDDSDLDPRYAMQDDADARDDVAVFGSGSAMRRPGMSALALPTRHRRPAPHLRKPEFLLDIFPVPDEPASALNKDRRRATPSSASKCPTNPLDDMRKDFLESSFEPAPALVPLPPHHHSHQRPSEPPRVSSRSDTRSMAARKVAHNDSGKSPSKMNVRGFFRAMGGRKSDI